jgi:hypothetical protein
MRSLKSVVVLGLLTLLFVSPAFAQRGPMGGMGAPQFQGVLNPVVGSGATYEVDNKTGKNNVDISVVGKEDANGKSGYWLEMGVAMPGNGGQMFTKLLMVVDGKNVAPSRMIMQMAGQPPMEMPMEGMMANMQRNASVDIRDTAQKVGTESLTTPAGTFSADHYRSQDGSWDVWLADKVGPWGIVKSVSGDTTMIVTKVTTSAKDQITGTPQKFDPAQMMRGAGRGR